MKPIRIRHTNDTDLSRTFSAKILGGSRGFEDACAMETFSNDFTPTLKCMSGFTLIVEVERVSYYPIGRERTEEEKKRRHLYGDKGAKFSGGKQMCILKSGVMGSITTFATKDCLVCEVYE